MIESGSGKLLSPVLYQTGRLSRCLDETEMALIGVQDRPLSISWLTSVYSRYFYALTEFIKV